MVFKKYAKPFLGVQELSEETKTKSDVWVHTERSTTGASQPLKNKIINIHFTLTGKGKAAGKIGYKSLQPLPIPLPGEASLFLQGSPVPEPSMIKMSLTFLQSVIDLDVQSSLTCKFKLSLSCEFKLNLTCKFKWFDIKILN